MNKALEICYNHSPALFQNLAVSLYGAKLYRREYGSKFRHLLEQFETMQWYSLDELKAYQNEQLRRLVAHCYENVPHYREAMDQRTLKPADIRTADDLRLLPLLTRADVKHHAEKLVATNVKRSELIEGHTSGTTGSPLQFLWDKQICLVKNVVDWRQKRWGGINPGDRLAFFLGRVIVPTTRKKPPFWRHNWTLNHLFLSSFHMSPDNLELCYQKLTRFKPRAIEGYPSTLYIFARFLLATGRTFPVHAAFTSSETLFSQQRKAIEQAFCCELFDFYGLAERTVFATECTAHEGHHLNMDFGITEILDKDGRPIPSGQLGRIVTTGLHSYAMPLVRYVTGDVTAMKPHPCSCGRAFPLMEDVTTKAEDIITTRDGRYISSSALTHPFKPLHSVAESQIIQEDREHIRIKIVKLPSYEEKEGDILLREFKKRVGEDMDVRLEFVDTIERTKAGKFRWVISKVPLEF
jgi:phenylacetate-CoA ligase